MDKLQVPTGMSLIARTAGIGRSVEELQWDLNYLLQLWQAIETAARSSAGAFLIYQESSLVIRIFLFLSLGNKCDEQCCRNHQKPPYLPPF